MSWTAVILLLALGADTFAVSLGFGLRGGSPRTLWRMSLVFATAEAVMPLVGWAVGVQISHLVGDWALALGALLLIALGVREWFDDDEEEDAAHPPVLPHGSALWIAALTVSLDELVLGVTLSTLGLSSATVIAWVFIQAVVGSILGVQFGRVLGHRLAARTEKAAAGALILVGCYLGVSLWI